MPWIEGMAVYSKLPHYTSVFMATPKKQTNAHTFAAGVYDCRNYHMRICPNGMINSIKLRLSHSRTQPHSIGMEACYRPQILFANIFITRSLFSHSTWQTQQSKWNFFVSNELKWLSCDIYNMNAGSCARAHQSNTPQTLYYEFKRFPRQTKRKIDNLKVKKRGTRKVRCAYELIHLYTYTHLIICTIYCWLSSFFFASTNCDVNHTLSCHRTRVVWKFVYFVCACARLFRELKRPCECEISRIRSLFSVFCSLLSRM